eukprot:TRINITY_DN3595_c0_g1_i1.p1 TRINITY_DN3595_c0_g1~~TRINITY_DN3595_c0_g1_i1.p1  ORF type:complete len:554 (-),score=70.45 TRINITY_DN3595_c0_g1_i1:151-1812(-)
MSFTDFQSHLVGLQDTLLNIDQYFMQGVDTSSSEYQLDIYFKESSKYFGNKRYASTKLNLQSWLNVPGLLDVSDLRSLKVFAHKTVRFNLKLGAFVLYLQNTEHQPVMCTNWTLTIGYDFQRHSIVRTYLRAENVGCHTKEYNDGGLVAPAAAVQIAVIILSSVSIFFAVKTTFYTGLLYNLTQTLHRHARRRNDPRVLSSSSGFQLESGVSNGSNGQQPLRGSSRIRAREEWLDRLLENRVGWQELTLREKSAFVDLSMIFHIVGNIFQFLSGLTGLISCVTPLMLKIIFLKEVLTGFGCMFAWFYALKLLEYDKRQNLMTHALFYARGGLMRFFLGFLPMMLAFAFLGKHLFWNYEKFETLEGSLVTLYALSNGDSVIATFKDLSAEGYIANAFIVIYILMFLSALQNVLVLVIMEGYEISRIMKKYDWATLTPAAQKQLVDELREAHRYEPQVIPKDAKPVERRESPNHREVENGEKMKRMEYGEAEGKLGRRAEKVVAQLETLQMFVRDIDEFIPNVNEELKKLLRDEYEQYLEYFRRKLRFRIIEETE